MTFTLADLDRSLPDTTPELRAALAARLEADGLLVPAEATGAENSPKSAVSDPLNCDNLLKGLEEVLDPPPSPPGLHPGQGPGPNLPEVKGRSGVDGTWRLPDNDEYIDEGGILRERCQWKPPTSKRKKRKLGVLDDSLGIQRELIKVYTDFHHGHINSVDYSRRIYGLTAIATLLNQDRKAGIEYARTLNDSIRVG